MRQTNTMDVSASYPDVLARSSPVRRQLLGGMGDNSSPMPSPGAAKHWGAMDAAVTKWGRKQGRTHLFHCGNRAVTSGESAWRSKLSCARNLHLSKRLRGYSLAAPLLGRRLKYTCAQWQLSKWESIE